MLLDERLIEGEDLPFVLDDYEQMFGPFPQRPWAWRYYYVEGEPKMVYIVAYESKAELEEKERFR